MPRKELVGKVISNKMEKTVVVAVENTAPHPKYGKQMVRTHKFKAHDEANSCKIGDRVRIRECRPLSRDKRFLVVDVTGRDNVTNVLEDSNA